MTMLDPINQSVLATTHDARLITSHLRVICTFQTEAKFRLTDIVRSIKREPRKPLKNIGKSKYG